MVRFHVNSNVTKYRFAEELQTDIGVARIRKWAKDNQALKEDDIFISTNVDEVLLNDLQMILTMFPSQVLSRDALHKLRWCQTTHPVLSGALWMPLGRFFQFLVDCQFQLHIKTSILCL